MGCSAAISNIESAEIANLEHRMIHLVVTNQTEELIALI